jgi:hypothetical protein
MSPPRRSSARKTRSLALRERHRPSKGNGSDSPCPVPPVDPPQGPRQVARGGLYVYHPVTYKGRGGWEIGKLLAGLGVFKLLPSSDPPRNLWRSVCSLTLPDRGSLAVAKTNHPGR